MKRLVGAVLLIVIFVFACVAALVFVTWQGGPLDVAHEKQEARQEFAGRVQAAHPFTAVYSLANNSSSEIEIEGVSLGNHSRGLRLVGALAQSGGFRYHGVRSAFPPGKTTSVPATTFVVRPQEGADLLVGLEASTTGKYFLSGLNVKYRVRYLRWYAPLFERTLTTTIHVCVQERAQGARTMACNPARDA